MTKTVAELVNSNSIVNPLASLALGVPVTQRERGDVGRYPLGVIVEIGEGRRGVWVRRFSDPADTSVWYSVDELDVATTADLAQIARTLLGYQYRETIDLKARCAREAARS